MTASTTAKVKSIRFVIWTAMMLATTTVWSAEHLGVGDSLPAFTGEDQHGEAFELSPAVQSLLISFDMATARAANAYLADQGAEFLDQYRATYIANVHGMPSVGRFFALRKMRRYPHRIVLSEAEQTLDPFPRQEGRLTVIKLGDDGRVASVDFWDPQQPDLLRLLQ